MKFAIAVIASGALFFLSSPLTSLWPLAWIAPAPVLAYALTASRTRSAAGAAFLAMVIGQMSWVRLVAGFFPPQVVATIVIAPSIVFTLITLITRRVSPSLPLVARSLVFPALSASIALITALTSPDGTAASMAYGQVRFTSLIAIVAVTGIPGITFLLTWFASSLAHALVNGRRAIGVLIWPSLAVAGACIFGVVQQRQLGGERVRIGLTADDPSAEFVGTTDSKLALSVVDGYARRVHALASRGAEIVVLPEKMVTVRDAATRDQARSRIAAAAREARVTVVAGLDERPENQERRNLAVVFSPTGEIIAEYDKHHMLAAFESMYRVGSSLSWLRPHIGVAICKDMDFPELSRRYSRENTGLLIVPAWDFVVDGELHSRMAVMRGVEGGFTVARSAQDGRLTFSDEHGRIIAETLTGADAMLVADVPLGSGTTLYARIGDMFGFACIALAVGLIAAAEVRRRRVATP